MIFLYITTLILYFYTFSKLYIKCSGYCFSFLSDIVFPDSRALCYSNQPTRQYNYIVSQNIKLRKLRTYNVLEQYRVSIIILNRSNVVLFHCSKYKTNYRATN